MAVETLAELYPRFSCPQEGANRDCIESVAVPFALGVTERFLHKYRSDLERSGRGVTELLGAWLESDPVLSEAWDPVFGLLGELLASRSPIDPLEAAARLCLSVGSHGFDGSWELEMQSLAHLRWGPYVLPSGNAVSAQTAAVHVSLQVGRSPEESRNIIFQRRPGGLWFCGEIRKEQQVPVAENLLTLLLTGVAESRDYRFLAEDLVGEADVGDGAMRLRDAIELLRFYAPDYLAWVDNVMRYVIPLRGGPGRIVSGSTRADTGISHISVDAQPAALAEMLVHEATHQYYYLVTRVQPVTDGADQNLYYSPIKGRARPIQYIHLAFHAFANVVLLGRTCVEAGYDDRVGYFRKNEYTLLPQLRQLEEGLRATDSLTDVGLDLWRPLSARVWA